MSRLEALLEVVCRELLLGICLQFLTEMYGQVKTHIAPLVDTEGLEGIVYQPHKDATFPGLSSELYSASRVLMEGA